MFEKLKINATIVATTALVITATITAPYTKMFGKNYKKNKDFTCCKGNQLVQHHYYTVNVFWLEVAKGYTEETMGKPSADGCNIKCVD